MRIDRTQTEIGSSAMATAPSARMAGAGPDHDGAESLLGIQTAARRAGILAAIVVIGLAIVAMPARGSAASLADILALSGVLVANVLAFVVLERFGRGAVRLAVAAGLLSVPFALIAGVFWTTGISWPVLAALGAFALMDGFFLRMSLRTPRDAAPKPGHGEIARLTALLGVALRGSEKQIFVTDIVGTIDHGADPAFRQQLVAELFPEGSLVSATLIADRVSLLKALSRAIHERQSSTGLQIRLRREPVGAGYPMPPRFEPYACTIDPVPGLEARAVVTLCVPEAADRIEGTDRLVALSPVTSVEEKHAATSGLVARALHDCNAPFNAGLGFLEMIADPRLAPRDIATYRDFAGEAHKAISEAHRNSVLLGHWLSVSHEGQGDLASPVEIVPGRLIADAIRAMNLREAVERGEIRVEEAALLPLARVPLPAARLGVEALLRLVHGRAQGRIGTMRVGDDLVISCSSADDGDDSPLVDAFHQALEAATTGLGPLTFGSTQPGERHLRFAGAFAGTAATSVPVPRVEDKTDTGIPEEVHARQEVHARLAS